jgi:hypothetical protein
MICSSVNRPRFMSVSKRVTDSTSPWQKSRGSGQCGGRRFRPRCLRWGISFYGPPIFLQALHASRGWPVSVVSGAITAHFLLGAAVVANLAALHHRFGLVAVTRAGALLTAFGLLGWAFAEAPWHLYFAVPVSGAGWAMTSGAALNAMVSP